MGGAITSTDKAVTDNKNSFQTAKLTTSDIQNSASYNAESYQVTVGSSGGAAGMGNDSGKASSTTTAAISGIAGNKAARTGDKETGIQKIFDAAKVKDEIGAQVAITTEFGKQAPRAVAKFADDQRADLLKQLKDEADPTKRAQLLAESKKWEEGGSYRVLMHTALGGLGGGVNGAIGAGMVASAAPLMNEMQDKLAATLVNAGLSEETAAAISKTVAQTTALATGAALGGAQGGAMALNVDANNRQLHPTEIQWIKANGKKFASQLSQSLGREVSEVEAMRWLTAAGESDVDANAQRSNGMFVRGTANTEEAQAYDAAKSFIVSNTKANNLFTDSQGQTQNLFTAKNGDFYKPEVYSQYRNDSQYRDYYWNVMGINLKGDNMTPQEKALYDQRQAIVDKQTVKELALLGIVAASGKVAVKIQESNASLNRQVAIDEGMQQRILNIPKGERPNVETYMPPDYIAAHLQDFQVSGVVRFTSRTSYEKYGSLGPDGGFVFPKNQFDSLMAQSNGNLSFVEKKLGLPSGYLASADTMAVSIKPADISGLKVPSGNEPGVLPQWIPGGFTQGGMPEAVMNFSNKPKFVELKFKAKIE